ncbi:MAG: metal-dependent hydrolase [Gammaproteobacteria bacterium]|nr:metal-dependent hydrolase [Gammaproteobacteria bacterium]
MDSISQFVLGAAIGELTLGRRIGRKAIVVGGLVGTLPDLDVLFHYADAVASYTYHRSWSHSLVVLGLVSPFLAWFFHLSFPHRWVSQHESSESGLQPLRYANWFWCMFLVLTTHPVLDGFTVYGTQLFWPFPVPPIALGSVFIIDPLYTLPLIIGLVVGYRNRHIVHRAMLAGLLVSSTYLVFTFVIQQHVRSIGVQSLQDQRLGSHNVLVAPTPFSLLWRVVSMDGEHYHEGFYSLLDQQKQVRFASYASNRQMIDEHYSHWPISRLDWFTNGMISAQREDNELIINDLRMGIEASFVFRFLVGQWNQSEFIGLESVQLPLELDEVRMRKLVQRAWNEKINVDP